MAAKSLRRGGVCSKGHRLTDDNIYLHHQGKAIRCRRCQIDHMAVYQRKRRLARTDRVDRLKGDHVTVYFISDGASHIKIGATSRNVETRIADMQVGNATELRVEATEPGGIDREQELHELFADMRAQGEWFRFTPDIACYIDDLRSLT